METQISVAGWDCLSHPKKTADTALIGNYIQGKTILVTGGAGSIGRELCRQLLGFSCKLLLIFDADENGLYETGIDFLENGFSDRFVLLLGSIKDVERVQEVMEKYQPALIFHAAAYKQVPLLEENPFEAIKNNVFGTRNVMNAAVQSGAELFLLISTDKAVHPVGVLGASKRIAEVLVQNTTASRTRLGAVRFGNVFGSRGSVVPRFEHQIRSGKPLTITAPDMRRYFITAAEAVALTLEAAAIAVSGEILALDMGDSVLIQDLAVEMIHQQGKAAGEIPIVYTGIRPGERLEEKLFFEEEAVQKQNGIFHCMADSFSIRQIEQTLEELDLAVHCRDQALLLTAIRRIIPEYPEKEMGK